MKPLSDYNRKKKIYRAVKNDMMSVMRSVCVNKAEVSGRDGMFIAEFYVVVFFTLYLQMSDIYILTL